MSKVNWKGRVRESGRWPSRFSSQNPWSCSSTVAHKHSAVFSFPRGKAVFFLPDFPHVWQTWPLLHKHYSIKKYVFLQTYLHCFNWIRLTMNLHWSTEINMRNHFIYGQIIKVYLKKKKKKGNENDSFFTRNSQRYWEEEKRAGSSAFTVLSGC